MTNVIVESGVLNSKSGTTTTVNALSGDFGLPGTFLILVDAVLQDPAAGTITDIDALEGTITFEVNEDYTGPISIQIEVEDEFDNIATATLEGEVAPNPDLGSPPVAEDDAYLVASDDVLRTDILSNDSDPDGSDIEITSVTITDADGNEVTIDGPFDPSEGIEVQSADGRTGVLALDETGADPFVPRTLAFDPNGGFDDLEDGETDTVTITYTIKDEDGQEDSASVTLTIEPGKPIMTTRDFTTIGTGLTETVTDESADINVGDMQRNSTLEVGDGDHDIEIGSGATGISVEVGDGNTKVVTGQIDGGAITLGDGDHDIDTGELGTGSNDVSITVGDGNSDINFEDTIQDFARVADPAITAGDGNHNVTGNIGQVGNGGTNLSVGSTVTVDLGDGDSNITMANSGGTGTVRVIENGRWVTREVNESDITMRQLDIDTGDGDQTIKVETGVRDLDIDLGDGDQSIDIDGNVTTADITTGNGDVTLEMADVTTANVTTGNGAVSLEMGNVNTANVDLGALANLLDDNGWLVANPTGGHAPLVSNGTATFNRGNEQTYGDSIQQEVETEAGVEHTLSLDLVNTHSWGNTTQAFRIEVLDADGKVIATEDHEVKANAPQTVDLKFTAATDTSRVVITNTDDTTGNTYYSDGQVRNISLLATGRDDTGEDKTLEFGDIAVADIKVNGGNAQITTDTIGRGSIEVGDGDHDIHTGELGTGTNDVAISVGDGNSRVQFDDQIQMVNNATRVDPDIDAGDGNHEIIGNIGQNSNGTTLSVGSVVTVDLGDGDSSITMNNIGGVEGNTIRVFEDGRWVTRDIEDSDVFMRQLDIDTGDGDQTIKVETQVRDLDIDLGDGDQNIDVDGAVTTADITTGDGDVTLELADVTTANISTGQGAVTMTMGDSTTANIDLGVLENLVDGTGQTNEGWTINNPSGSHAPHVSGGNIYFNRGGESTFGDSVEQDIETEVGVEHTLTLDLPATGGYAVTHHFEVQVLDANGDVIATETASSTNSTAGKIDLKFTPTTATSQIVITNTDVDGYHSDGRVANVSLTATGRDFTGEDKTLTLGDIDTADINIGGGDVTITTDTIGRGSITVGDGDHDIHTGELGTGMNDVSITVGDGDSCIEFDDKIQMVNTPRRVDPDINAGDGNHKITGNIGQNGAGTTRSVGSVVTVELGDGDSTIDMLNAGATGQIRVIENGRWVTRDANEDDVFMQQLDIDAGTGDQTIKVETMVRDLDIDLGDGTQTITLEGDVTTGDMTFGEGIVSLTAEDITTANITMGDGLALFDIGDMNIANIDVGDAVPQGGSVITTGNIGTSDINVGDGDHRITTESITQGSITLGDGNQTITTETIGQGSITVGDGNHTILTGELGTGMNDVSITVGNGDSCIEFTDQIQMVNTPRPVDPDINAGDGDHKIIGNIGQNSNGTMLSVGSVVTVELGDGDSSITMNNIGGAEDNTIRVIEDGRWVTREIEDSDVFMQTLDIDTGEGDQTIKVETMVRDLDIDLGDGDQNIDIDGNVTTADMKLGDGDVTLEMADITTANIQTGQGAMDVEIGDMTTANIDLGLLDNLVDAEGWTINNPTGSHAPLVSNGVTTFNRGNEQTYGDSIQQDVETENGVEHTLSLDLVNTHSWGNTTQGFTVQVLDADGNVLVTEDFEVMANAPQTAELTFTAATDTSRVVITNTDATSGNTYYSDGQVRNISLTATGRDFTGEDKTIALGDIDNADINIGGGNVTLTADTIGRGSITVGDGDHDIHTGELGTGMNDVSITVGDGDSCIEFDDKIQMVNQPRRVDPDINAGDGNHKIMGNIGQNAAGNRLSVGSVVTVELGDGDSDIQMLNAGGSGTFQTLENGRWIVRYVEARDVFMQQLDIDAGNGDQTIKVETMVRDLDIDLGDGDNDIDLDGLITDADINIGDGDLNFMAENITTADIAIGDGAVTFETGDITTANITMGDGEKTVTIEDITTSDITMGDGDVTLEMADITTANIQTGQGAMDVEIGDMTTANIDLGVLENLVDGTGQTNEGWTVNNPSGSHAPWVGSGNIYFNRGGESTFGDSVEQEVETEVGVEHTLSLDLPATGGYAVEHFFEVQVLDANGDVIATETASSTNSTAGKIDLKFTPTTATSQIVITNTDVDGHHYHSDGRVSNVSLTATGRDFTGEEKTLTLGDIDNADINIGGGDTTITTDTIGRGSITVGDGDHDIHTGELGTGMNDVSITVGDGDSCIEFDDKIQIVNQPRRVDPDINAGDGNHKIIGNIGQNAAGNRLSVGSVVTVELGDGDSDIQMLNAGGSGTFQTLENGRWIVRDVEARDVFMQQLDIDAGNGDQTIKVETMVRDLDIDLGDGDNDIDLDGLLTDADITIGDGDLNFSAEDITTIDMSVGDGDVIFDAGNITTANITMGDGEKTFTTEDITTANITMGDGEKTVTIEDITTSNITMGDGDVTLRVGQVNAGTITAGDGNHDIMTGELGVGMTDVVINVGNGNSCIEFDDRVQMVNMPRRVDPDINAGDGDHVIVGNIGQNGMGTTRSVGSVVTVEVGDGDSTIVMENAGATEQIRVIENGRWITRDANEDDVFMAQLEVLGGDGNHTIRVEPMVRDLDIHLGDGDHAMVLERDATTGDISTGFGAQTLFVEDITTANINLGVLAELSDDSAWQVNNPTGGHAPLVSGNAIYFNRGNEQTYGDSAQQDIQTEIGTEHSLTLELVNSHSWGNTTQGFTVQVLDADGNVLVTEDYEVMANAPQNVDLQFTAATDTSRIVITNTDATSGNTYYSDGIARNVSVMATGRDFTDEDSVVKLGNIATADINIGGGNTTMLTGDINAGSITIGNGDQFIRTGELGTGMNDVAITVGDGNSCIEFDDREQMINTPRRVDPAITAGNGNHIITGNIGMNANGTNLSVGSVVTVTLGEGDATVAMLNAGGTGRFRTVENGRWVTRDVEESDVFMQTLDIQAEDGNRDILVETMVRDLDIVLGDTIGLDGEQEICLEQDVTTADITIGAGIAEVVTANITTVTFDKGDGDLLLKTENLDTATITAGDGDHLIETETIGRGTMTLGDGNHLIHTGELGTGMNDVEINIGAGNSLIEFDDMIQMVNTPRAVDPAITAGDGDHTIVGNIGQNSNGTTLSVGSVVTVDLGDGNTTIAMLNAGGNEDNTIRVVENGRWVTREIEESDIFMRTLDIEAGSGDHKILVETMVRDLDIALGDGDKEIDLEGLVTTGDISTGKGAVTLLAENITTANFDIGMLEDLIDDSGWLVENPTGGHAPLVSNGQITFNRGNEQTYGDSVQQDVATETGIEHSLSLELVNTHSWGNTTQGFTVQVLDADGNVLVTEDYEVMANAPQTVDLKFTAATDTSRIVITNTDATSGNTYYSDGLARNISLLATGQDFSADDKAIRLGDIATADINIGSGDTTLVTGQIDNGSITVGDGDHMIHTGELGTGMNDVAITVGDGDSCIEFDDQVQMVNNPRRVDPDINAGDGNHVIVGNIGQNTNGTMASVGSVVTVEVGDGDSEIAMLNAGATGNINVVENGRWVNREMQDDEVFMQTLDIDGGDGNHTVLAETMVRDLDIDLGNGSRHIQIDGMANNATMNLGDGDTTLVTDRMMVADIKVGDGDATVETGQIDRGSMTFGDGDHNIHTGELGIGTGDVTITAGDGDSFVEFDDKEQLVNNATRVDPDINLGDGNHVVIGNIGQNSAGTTQSVGSVVTVELGDGDGEIAMLNAGATGQVRVIENGRWVNRDATEDDVFMRELGIDAGDGDHKILVESMVRDLDITLGDGTNEIQLDGLATTADITTGKGAVTLATENMTTANIELGMLEDLVDDSGWLVSNPTGGHAPLVSNGQITFNRGNEQTYGDSVRQDVATETGIEHSLSLELVNTHPWGNTTQGFTVQVLDADGNVLVTEDYEVMANAPQTVDLKFTAATDTSRIVITNTDATSGNTYYSDGLARNISLLATGQDFSQDDKVLRLGDINTADIRIGSGDANIATGTIENGAIVVGDGDHVIQTGELGTGMNDVEITVGDGNSCIEFDDRIQMVNQPRRVDPDINAGDGDHVIVGNIGQNAAGNRLSVGSVVTVELGDGDTDIAMMNAGGTGTIQVVENGRWVTRDVTEDDVFMQQLDIDGGNGDHTVLVETMVRDLDIDLGNGDRQIQLDGMVNNVFMNLGDGELTLDAGRLMVADITAGDGKAIVEVDQIDGGSMTFGDGDHIIHTGELGIGTMDVEITVGNGNSCIEFDDQIQNVATAARRVDPDINAGDGNHTIIGNIGQNTNGTNASVGSVVTVELGEGDSTIAMLNAGATGNIRVVENGRWVTREMRDDEVFMNQLDIDAEAGSHQILVETMVRNATIDLEGAGGDFVILDGGLMMGMWRVNTNDGDDIVLINGMDATVGDTNDVFDLGAGNDRVIIYGGGSLGTMSLQNVETVEFYTTSLEDTLANLGLSAIDPAHCDLSGMITPLTEPVKPTLTDLQGLTAPTRPDAQITDLTAPTKGTITDPTLDIGSDLDLASEAIGDIEVTKTTDDTATRTINPEDSGADFTPKSTDFDAPGDTEVEVSKPTLDIRGPNEGPDAVDDTFGVDEGVLLTGSLLANDSDPDGDDLKIISAGGTDFTPGTPNVTVSLTSTGGRTASAIIFESGALNIAVDQSGNFEDLAEGETDTLEISYVISDGNGASDTATATITVNGLNDGPVAQDDAATIPEDGLAVANLLENDSDVDGDTLTIVEANGTAAGTTFQVTSAGGRDADVFVAESGDLNFALNTLSNFSDLNDGETDTVTVTYTITDGNGATDTAEMVVTIEGSGTAGAMVSGSIATTGNGDRHVAFILDTSATAVGTALGFGVANLDGDSKVGTIVDLMLQKVSDLALTLAPTDVITVIPAGYNGFMDEEENVFTFRASEIQTAVATDTANGNVAAQQALYSPIAATYLGFDFTVDLAQGFNVANDLFEGSTGVEQNQVVAMVATEAAFSGQMGGVFFLGDVEGAYDDLTTAPSDAEVDVLVIPGGAFVTAANLEAIDSDGTVDVDTTGSFGLDTFIDPAPTVSSDADIVSFEVSVDGTPDTNIDVSDLVATADGFDFEPVTLGGGVVDATIGLDLDGDGNADQFRSLSDTVSEADRTLADGDSFDFDLNGFLADPITFS